MRANDVKPTRLAAAISAMDTFLQHLPPQFKVGLMAFSDTAQLLVAPTLNRQLVRTEIGYLQPEAGTAIGDGLASAVKVLMRSLTASGYVRKPGQFVPGAIVLSSDGAQNRGVLQPAQAAQLAKNAGIRVYPVSLGTPNGKVSFGYGAFTDEVPVPPDPTTMAMIARTTGGESYDAQTASTAYNIYRTLGSSVGRTTKDVQITSWFAFAAAVCLLGAVALGRRFGALLP
jgi:Ca-activated chloride channel family protein